MKTIIKLLTIMIFMLSSQLISAQQSLEIIGVPENSYGYLVWKTDPAVVAYSICSIVQHDIVGSDTISTILARHEIWDRNYFKVPDQYWKPNQGTSAFSAEVTVFNASHSTVGDDDVPFGPIGGVGQEVECTNNTCISSDYAYKIKVVQVGGQYTYTQDYAYASISDEGMQVPYYRWFTPAEFGLYTGLLGDNGAPQGDPRYHSIAEWDAGLLNIEDTRIIKITGNQGSEYCDNNGATIVSSTVYGIRKAFWHWWEEPYRVEFWSTDQCADGNYTSVQGFINFMNTNATNGNNLTNRPPLACNEELSGPNCGIIDWGDDTPSPPTVLPGVKIKFKPDTGDDDDDDGSELGLILSDCELFNITTLTRNPINVISMTGADFLDANGAPSAFSISLNPGLHKVTLKMPNQHLEYIVFETTETLVFTIPHKDYFDALIYPNPNTEGFYFIDIETSAHLKPKYEVFDGIGTKIWEQDFDLPQDHDGTHRIEPQANFPNGYILHKFTFQDGSHETITTLKQ